MKIPGCVFKKDLLLMNMMLLNNIALSRYLLSEFTNADACK
jgi:hypothetical protein